MPDKIIIERHSEKWVECVKYILIRDAHSGNKNADPIGIVKKKYALLKADEEYLKLLMYLKSELFSGNVDLETIGRHVDKQDLAFFDEMEEVKNEPLSMSANEIDDMLSVLD